MGPQDWATPPNFFHWLNARYNFTVDVCARKDNAKCADYISLEEGRDSLNVDWFPWDDSHKVAFCNPGFSNVLAWHHKAHEETANHYGSVAVILGIAGASQDWFKFAWDHCTDILLCRPRIQYLAPPGITQSSNNRECAAYVYKGEPRKQPYPNFYLCEWKRDLDTRPHP